MIYRIDFPSGATAPCEPYEFEAANDHIALEWLHIIGCGINARLWREDTLLCAVPSGIGGGFLLCRRAGTRPYGRGWRIPPSWPFTEIEFKYRSSSRDAGDADSLNRNETATRSAKLAEIDPTFKVAPSCQHQASARVHREKMDCQGESATGIFERIINVD